MIGTYVLPTPIPIPTIATTLIASHSNERLGLLLENAIFSSRLNMNADAGIGSRAPVLWSCDSWCMNLFQGLSWAAEGQESCANWQRNSVEAKVRVH